MLDPKYDSLIFTANSPDPLIGPPDMLGNQSFELKIPKRTSSTARNVGSSRLSDGLREDSAVSRAFPQVVSWCLEST